MSQTHQGKYLSPGEMIDYTPGSPVTGGDVIVQNNIVAIAKTDIAANAKGALAIGGIFDIVKAAAEAFATVGANIFWDTVNIPQGGTVAGCVTATAAGNTWCGFVLETAEATDETVRILLRSTVTLTAESFALADLSDIVSVDYTAGDILVAQGPSTYDDVPLTGPFNLAATGLLSMDSATVAAFGSVQGDAAALADGFSLVSAANGTKGVVLPAAAAGGLCVVKNNANAILKLWPNTSDAIDALGADNAMSVPAYATLVLVAYDVTTWYSTAIAAGQILNADINAAAAIARSKLAQEDLAVYRIPIQNCRSNTGLVLDVTGGATLFSIVNGGFGTGTLTLKGEDALSNTKTDTLCFEYPLPPEYVDGQTIEVDVEVKVDSSGAGNASVETLQVEAWLLGDAGAVGSDLASGGAQNLAAGGDVFQTITSSITPTGLVAGDKLIIFVQTVITEDAATAVFAVIGNIEVQLDIKG